MSDARMVGDTPQILLTGRRLRIVRLSDHRLLIRSACRWVYSLLALILCLLGAFALWICTLWVYFAAFHPAPQPEQNIAGIVCGLPCAIFWALMLVAMTYLLLTMALPRRTVIDLDAGIIQLRQIPGLSRELTLADVSTVDLVMFTSKGTCHLGFTDRQTGRLHSCHWLGGEFDSAITNRNQLLPAARLIARFIDRPLESSWGGIRWHLYKGPSEPLPPT